MRQYKIQNFSIWVSVFISILVWNGDVGHTAAQARLKELTEIQGVRSNQLFGYGLVVGLNGTGDKTDTVFTSQSLMNMMDKLGIAPSKISRFGLESSGSEMKVKNVAAVFITAELGPYVKPGNQIDVTLSSIGDSKSLEGGTLIMTPLQGADGRVYAVAQGAVSIGGHSSTSPEVTHPTVGHIPGGATVEHEVPMNFLQNGQIIFNLKQPDFTVVSRITNRINENFPATAKTINSGSVAILIPEAYLENPVQFIADLEQLKVRSDAEGKIVINERTGTIVTGEHVVISQAAVSHGRLTVSIQPEGNAQENRVLLVEDSISVGDVAKNLNVLGATPTDMIAIFQAMKKAGAIQAQLHIM